MLNFINSEKRNLAKLEKKIAPILEKEIEFSQKSDQDLKDMTRILKNRLKNGESLDDIYVDAFATVREASRRVVGLFPYKEQLMAGYVLHKGDIAEQKTGEGKSLTAVMPMYLNALEGKGVHIVTVNEYLSERDKNEIGCICEWLGLTVGLNKASLTNQEKQAAFACDITYTTNSEVGFDYLRDNMVTSPASRVLRGLNFALIDECDSILIDDSRTPLIISSGVKENTPLYRSSGSFAASLKNGADVDIDVRSKTVQLTHQGIEKAERRFGVKDLYAPENGELLHFITNALKAEFVMKKDVDYVVNQNGVQIVDPNTGRIMDGRQWSNGLHQAVEAKENCPIQQETMTVATITYQNFFRLYGKLAGMTGTAKTEEEEFLEIYNMKVTEIPTHKPVARIDQPDFVYGSKKAKYAAILQEVKERHEKGQPVLVGTVSVEVSELLSNLFTKARIPHNVLNAKNHEREAEIIANAGQKGAVTIATNMAGRGTDIKLGEGVKELGGLYVIGSERHESRRIDNQLRGRSGRQGDPGESRFFISTQDDLMVRFGSERLESLLKSFQDEKVESKSVSKSIENAQVRVEGVNYDSRKNLLRYDDVMARQREEMYAQRNFIMEHADVHEMVLELIKKCVDSLVVVDEESRKNRVDEEATKRCFHQIGIDLDCAIPESPRDAKEKLLDMCYKIYERKLKDVGDAVLPIEKEVLLNVLDKSWMKHIDAMDKLKNGIGLRSYAQKDPFQAYVQESYDLFNRMVLDIAKGMTAFCMTVVFRPKPLEN